ncbi:LacI family DNA-binding transcriptional regulator [Terriglobus saanensis]|uniref:Transcriptional regulator, LacI family n=1 Tax=Terriglobus saanensis (strain ATCC BAA-1853 / DSM 23119 / SP1PR4) TaxID=401053 RepID=E8UYP4_TERSS|nr:LacI family DNA-binding transcriptional regulator [Terriglobus saanensis]ADV83197.1 transcriptional regulator, LacI family [Terriglobus saanensis SP1PR4]
MAAPKLADIAKRAGVSIAAVSIALNNRDTKRVSEAKRNEIRKIAEELNYVPNELAKALAERRTRLLGLMVPLRDPIFFNHFIAQMLSGIQTTLMRRGYNLLLYSPSGKPGRSTRDQILESRFTDGLIFVNTRFCSVRNIAETIQELDAAKIKFAMINSYYGHAPVNYVGVDDPAIGEAAVNYLVQGKHRRIAFLSGSGKLPTHIHLLQGIRRAMTAHGLELPTERIGCSEYDEVTAFTILDRWFANKRTAPTAIFCADDQLLMHLYDYVEIRGKKIPEDVAVLGRGNAGLMSLLRPRPTAFHIPTFEMGEVAAEILIDSIEKPEQKRQRVLLASQLHPGDTA